jgi:hypothetical protein
MKYTAKGSLALWKRRLAYRQKKVDLYRGKAKAPAQGEIVVSAGRTRWRSHSWASWRRAETTRDPWS